MANWKWKAGANKETEARGLQPLLKVSDLAESLDGGG